MMMQSIGHLIVTVRRGERTWTEAGEFGDAHEHPKNILAK